MSGWQRGGAKVLGSSQILVGWAMKPEALYAHLEQLAETMPDLSKPGPLPASSHQWLGRLLALADSGGHHTDITQVDEVIGGLPRPLLN